MKWASTKGNVYIGRNNKLMKSNWGNPYILDSDDHDERLECVLRYYFHVTHSDLFLDLYQLCNANYLGCWCAPELCHGDILLYLLNNSVIYCFFGA